MPWRSKLPSSIAPKRTTSTNALGYGRPGEQQQQQPRVTDGRSREIIDQPINKAVINDHGSTDITQRGDDIQQRVDDVVSIMFQNVALVLERDANISALEIQAENLQIQALEFRRIGKRLLVRYYMRKYQYLVVALPIIIIILAITAALLYLLATIFI